VPILVPSVYVPPAASRPALAHPHQRDAAGVLHGPGGLTTKLSDWENGWLLQPGAKGLDMPPTTSPTDESPGIDGYAIRQVRAQGKEIALPIAFWADDSRAAYQARRRTLIRSLNPKRGVGT
jgi:hypothetical protein